MNSSRNALLSAAGTLVLLGSLGAGVFARHAADQSVPEALETIVPRDTPLVASLADEPSIPESDFFFRLVELVKREYVDPVKDENKLAIGAVRGMVGSLVDPLANFMGPEQFSAFTNTQRGIYAGIGIETQFRYDNKVLERIKQKQLIRDPAELVPQLLVTAVAPGGPADLAGVKPGDRIDSVNGRWILSAAKITAFRSESKAIRESKRTATEIDQLLREMQTRAKDGLTPARARDQITVGESGTIKLSWEHAGKVLTADVTKQRTRWPALQTLPDGTIRLAIFAQTAGELRKAIQNTKTLRLDLRDQPQGNYDALKAVLSELAPVGIYGGIANERGRPVQPFRITEGTTTKRSITLIVNESTRGAAEILALALSSRNIAKLTGKATKGDRAFVAVLSLPEGNGYTLPVGLYQVAAPPPVPAARPATKSRAKSAEAHS